MKSAEPIDQREGESGRNWESGHAAMRLFVSLGLSVNLSRV